MTAILARSSSPADSLTAVPLNVPLPTPSNRPQKGRLTARLALG
jgi:hypothetical protein